MDNTTAPNNNMKKFLILIVAAIVLVAAVAVGVFFATRGGNAGDKEYLPNNDLWSGEDPSGYDEDHTARY